MCTFAVKSIKTNHKMKRNIRILYVMVLLCTMGISQLKADNTNWMSTIPDNTFVSQLSIPGAHDAGTGHGTSSDTFARTQDKTLTEQWNSGIRAFDLRPSVDSDRLRIYHGIISTNLYLDDALSTLCSLLDSHPTETCIVVMRHEDDHDDGDASWGTKMKSLLTSSPTSTHAVNFDPMAKLGDVRGKMIILSRNTYDEGPIGGFISNWNSNSNFDQQQGGKITGVGTQGPLYVQDFYDVSASGAPATKTASIQRMLQFSTSENTNPNLWVINQTSGYSETLFSAATRNGYRANAETQNPVVINYLDNSSKGSTGIIFMDCAAVNTSGNYSVRSQDLTDALIANNSIDGPNTDYFRALATIEDGTIYRVFTEESGTKYYLTNDGYLTNNANQAGAFTFSRVQGNAYYYGFQLLNAYFTNPPAGGNPTLNNGHIDTDATSARTNWEAQVFFLNSDGKYAVRATNAAGGDSGWSLNARAYWTVNSGSSGPLAEYSFDKNYVWQLEKLTNTIEVAYHIYFNNTEVKQVTATSAPGQSAGLPQSEKRDFCSYTYTPTTISSSTSSVRVDVTWNGPFVFCDNVADAQWYSMTIRSDYSVFVDASEPYYPKTATDIAKRTSPYLWAFGGNPYGVVLYNKSKGAGYSLKKDGNNVVMRSGTYTWDILREVLSDDPRKAYLLSIHTSGASAALSPIRKIPSHIRLPWSSS